MNTLVMILPIFISIIAIIFSIVSFIITLKSQRRLLKLNFLLPKLSELSEYIKIKFIYKEKVSNDNFFNTLLDVKHKLIKNEAIIRGIKLGHLFDDLFKKENQDNFPQNLIKLIEEIDNYYLKNIKL